MFHRTRFEELDPLNGFDEGGGWDGRRKVPFQMIPVGGSRKVRLQHAADLRVESTQPNAVSVSGPNTGGVRTIVLQGLAEVNCLIQAKKGSEVVASLEASPKPSRKMTVTFCFVEDAGGHKTKRSRGCVQPMIDGVNRILKPQANIEVSLRQAYELRTTENFGRVLRFSRLSARNEMYRLAQERDRLADATVFFLPRLEGGGLTRDKVEAAQYAGGLFLEDRMTGEDSRTLAHELVHHILEWVVDGTSAIKDHSPGLRSNDLLMHPSSPRGERLSAAQINALNGWQTWLPVENAR